MAKMQLCFGWKSGIYSCLVFLPSLISIHRGRQVCRIFVLETKSKKFGQINPISPDYVTWFSILLYAFYIQYIASNKLKCNTLQIDKLVFKRSITILNQTQPIAGQASWTYYVSAVFLPIISSLGNFSVEVHKSSNNCEVTNFLGDFQLKCHLSQFGEIPSY